MAPAPDAGRLGAPHDGPDRSPRFRRGQRRCPLALAGLLVTFGTPAVVAPLAFDEPEPTRSADGTLQLSWAEALGDELHDYELQLRHEGESRRVYTGRRPEAHVSGLPDGRYELRVRMREGDGWSPWSEPKVLVVQHHPMSLVWTLLALGALVLTGTAVIVLRSDRGSR